MWHEITYVIPIPIPWHTITSVIPLFYDTNSHQLFPAPFYETAGYSQSLNFKNIFWLAL